MNRLNKKIITFIVIYFSINTSLMGQWLFNSTVNREYNTNPFYMPDPVSSWITTSEIGIGKNFDNTSIYYTGDYILFDKLNERNFYWHQLQFSGNLGKHNWGLTAEQRLNKAEDNIYDYSDWGGFVNLKTTTQKIHINLRVQTGFTNFPNMTEMNNWKYGAYLKGVKSFPTKTTFLSGINLNHKKYTNVFIPSDSVNLSTDEMLYSLGGGYGGGGGGSGGGGQGGGGSIIGSNSNSETPSTSTLKWWVRLAQSLFPKTGIAIQYDHQFILSGDSRVLVGNVLNYQLENIIFDDPLNYESNRTGIQLTQIFPANFSFIGNYFITHKNYPYQGIYLNYEDYNDTVERSDDHQIINLSLSKTLNGFIGQNIDLNLKYQFTYLKNESNSFWYNYDNQLSSIYISLLF